MTYLENYSIIVRYVLGYKAIARATTTKIKSGTTDTNILFNICYIAWKLKLGIVTKVIEE